MRASPSLRIYQPLNMGGQYTADISRYQERYRQTIKLYGGFWDATWDMANMSATQMINFFKTRIGYHLVVSVSNIPVWEGLIWSMDLTQKGVMRRISLDQTRNSIQCIYTDVSDDTRKETSFYENAASIARYGKIQEIVYLDKTTTGAAEAYAQTVLAENQIPIPFIVAVKQPKAEETTTLRVSAVGYAYTLNYQYLALADTTVTITAAINSALSAHSEFVTAGFVETNAVQVQPPATETRVWDWLLELAEIGDGAAPHTLQVLSDQRLFYKILSSQPTLRWDGKRLTKWSGYSLAAGKWSARPGILRDLTWDNIPLPDVYFLENQRDNFVSEVTASTEYNIPLLKADDQPDADMIVALTRTLNELEYGN